MQLEILILISEMTLSSHIGSYIQYLTIQCTFIHPLFITLPTLIHFSTNQSLFPFSPLMIIWSLFPSSPPPVSLSPSIPLGPSAAVLPFCSATPRVLRLPEDVDWMVVPEEAWHCHVLISLSYTHTHAHIFTLLSDSSGPSGAAPEHAGYLRSQ